MAKDVASRFAAPRAWQRMLSGRRLDLLDPSPMDIEIEDIAHGLARVARWNGQTKGEHIFSVAQHSLLVEAFARKLEPQLLPQDKMIVLLHDAPEYVVGDIISPFKAVLSDAYKAVENRILAAVHLRFGLPAKVPLAVAKLCKQADKAAAFCEATALADFDLVEAEKFFGLPKVRLPNLDALLAPQTSDLAEAEFLSRFRALEAECG